MGQNLFDMNMGFKGWGVLQNIVNVINNELSQHVSWHIIY